MSNHIHPLVLATIEEHRARRELELERLRSARNACTTASPGGQSRAMAIGKKIREVEEITSGWRLAMATLTTEEMLADGSATDMAELIREAKGEAEALRVVGSRSPRLGKLRCIRCTAEHRARLGRDSSVQDVTFEDLPDGGMCCQCHADVLA